jgi:site-specific DNA-methyltransferase (adenine-specific)
VPFYEERNRAADKTGAGGERVRREVIGNIELTCEDCMDFMKRYPDGHFDLAIVDPPYGGGNHNMKNLMYNGVRNKSYDKANKIKEWDNAPSGDYFNELFRVSKYQIICGGNYFNLPPSRNFIIFYKEQISEDFSMAMAEFLWTNIDGNSKVFKYRAKPDIIRSHPCQKPIPLYKWLLSKYAKPGWKILDTHLGSGSHAVACYDMGFALTACEIDEDYFEAAVKRLRLFASQGTLDFGGGE